MIDFTNEIDEYFTRLKNTINAIDRDELNKFINLLIDARNLGKTIFVIGNGGSAATASHSVCDFNKGLSFGNDKRFKFLCLNDNIYTISAYSNDVDYDMAYVEQLKNFCKKDDLLIGISGSGNSKNILLAVDYANSIGATTVGITGYDGGKLRKLAEYSLNANVNDMQISEDLHMIFFHLAMKVIYNENC